MIELDKIEAKIAKIEEELEPIYKERDKLIRKVIYRHSRLRTLKEQRDELLSEKKSNDWEWILYEDHGESAFHYKLREKKLRELGLSSLGFWEETKQVAICLHIADYSDMDKQIVGLNKIVKYLKPIKVDNYRNKVIYIQLVRESTDYDPMALYIDKKTNKAHIWKKYYYSNSKFVTKDPISIKEAIIKLYGEFK